MHVPKAPWTAVATATAFASISTAAVSLPHSKALRSFSLFLFARQRMGMSDFFEDAPTPPRGVGEPGAASAVLVDHPSPSLKRREIRKG